MTFRISPRALGATFFAAAVGLLSVPAASASPSIKLGILDDAQTINFPGAAFADYTELGVQVVRINLRWNEIAATPPSGPGGPTHPESYPLEKWQPYDTAIRAAEAAGIDALLVFLGTPSWANGGRSFQFAPSSLQLQSFARAAALRYRGDFDDSRDLDPVLPQVHFWGAWNEPNLHTFLRPQWKRINRRWVSTAPIQYARICNQVYNGVHGAQTLDTTERVACGLTSPRGNNIPGSASPSHTPLLFLRGMKRGGAKFDAYGHQPYSLKNSPTWKPSSSHMISLGNISLLVQELTRLYGKKKVWLTEYGFETNPPDPQLGVSQATQSAWLRQAFGIAKRHVRIDMFVWFLLVDEQDRNGSAFGVPGWQSGLRPYNWSPNVRKPAFATFTSLAP